MFFTQKKWRNVYSQMFASGYFSAHKLQKPLAFCEFASIKLEPCSMKSVKNKVSNSGLF